MLGIAVVPSSSVFRERYIQRLFRVVGNAVFPVAIVPAMLAGVDEILDFALPNASYLISDLPLRDRLSGLQLVALVIVHSEVFVELPGSAERDRLVIAGCLD